ncbi:hypothetical protein B484DRAFT_439864, partial [Ochromonadaceae sp. CCMP2298]
GGREGKEERGERREREKREREPSSVAGPNSRGSGPPPPPSPVHVEIGCNGCGVREIQGVRYKCSTCCDFDLCSTCIVVFESGGLLPHETASHLHQRDHLFLRLPRDVGINAPPALSNRSAWQHVGVGCVECGLSQIEGFRFFCTTCAVSFCEFCEQKGAPTASPRTGHTIFHSLLKMVPPPAPAPVVELQ